MSEKAIKTIILNTWWQQEEQRRQQEQRLSDTVHMYIFIGVRKHESLADIYRNTYAFLMWES